MSAPVIARPKGRKAKKSPQVCCMAGCCEKAYGPDKRWCRAHLKKVAQDRAEATKDVRRRL